MVSDSDARTHNKMGDRHLLVDGADEVLEQEILDVRVVRVCVVRQGPGLNMLCQFKSRSSSDRGNVRTSWSQ